MRQPDLALLDGGVLPRRVSRFSRNETSGRATLLSSARVNVVRESYGEDYGNSRKA